MNPIQEHHQSASNPHHPPFSSATVHVRRWPESRRRLETTAGPVYKQNRLHHVQVIRRLHKTHAAIVTPSPTAAQEGHGAEPARRPDPWADPARSWHGKAVQDAGMWQLEALAQDETRPALRPLTQSEETFFFRSTSDCVVRSAGCAR